MQKDKGNRQKGSYKQDGMTRSDVPQMKSNWSWVPEFIIAPWPATAKADCLQRPICSSQISMALLKCHEIQIYTWTSMTCMEQYR